MFVSYETPPTDSRGLKTNQKEIRSRSQGQLFYHHRRSDLVLSGGVYRESGTSLKSFLLTIVLAGDFGRRAVRSRYAPFALMIGLALLGWSILAG